MTTFCSLFSGSSGNVIYMGTDKGAVLIDCGMSGKQVLEALKNARLDPGQIRALLVTHEHSDHVKGAGVISRKLDIPVFATEGTWEGMQKCVGNIPAHHRVTITAGESFFFNDLEILPFSIPHDANDPVGFRLYAKHVSCAVATDLGHFSDTVRNAVTGADIVLLESNHDPDMLKENPHYPSRLKTRILGRKGHLSNDSGADAAVYLAQNGTKHLLLGHLSGENNTPDLAYHTSCDALSDAGADVGRDVTLHVASRHQASHLYTLS